MKKAINEDQVEQIVLDWLDKLGYEVIFGPDIEPYGNNPERKDFSEVVLKNRLRTAIDKIKENDHLPKEAKEDAIKQVIRTDSQKLELNNKKFHQLLVNGVNVQYRKQGRIVDDIVQLFDFNNINNNEFLAINQFTVVENKYNRRPDIILFVNGIPLVVIELKNPADENATVWKAYTQLNNYMEQIPSLFRFNEILIISDGLEAKAGTITASKERFMNWKTINGKKVEGQKLKTLVYGMLNKETLIDLVRHFITYEKVKKSGQNKLVKILAAYHQYNATNKALESTIKATKGGKKAGVVWHTQGSGKSLTMVFYAGKLILNKDMNNPTIVVLTDRNDLDDQLYGTFSRSHELLRQKPTQANSRNKLKEILSVASGGIVFTTIQKFMPEETREKYPLLSKRKNIVVIADEAHRSQYGFKAKVNKGGKSKIKYGFAKYVRDALPNASFIGFTGTPIEKSDKSTTAVFGDYVDIYDIKQSVDDGMTVKIFYESRLAKLGLKPEKAPYIDEEFEEVTEAEEVQRKEKLKSKWSRLEALVGSKKRLKKVAKDIVSHFENRLEIQDGKGMIVCMSRRICVDLYEEIIKIRPEWHNKNDNKGEIKVIMTGSSSDPKSWQQHIRNKSGRKEIAERMKDPNDPLKLVIVRDMWLTGFDVPSLHTMYLDKRMSGHTLMQAIARVNRVFKDKPGGVIVDYMGLAYELKKAVSTYTNSGGKGKPILDQKEAVALMLEKYEIVSDMFHGFNYKKFFKLKPEKRLEIIPQAMDYILKQEDGKSRFLKYTTQLTKAFALAVPHKKAMEIKAEVGFFQAIKSAINKSTSVSGKDKSELDSSIKQIISEAIVSDRIVDIFAAAGIKNPDISILSEEFMLEVKEMPQKNLALEMLKKLLNDEIRLRSKKNIVQARSFREMLEKTIKAYTNKSIEAAQVIEELLKIADKIKEADKRGEELNLSEKELAFYDALGTNDSAVKVLGDETLRKIAIELTETIRKNVTIDWTLRENVQAKLRVMVKRVLRKYDYPPDKTKKAVETVLEQAKITAKDWVKV